MTTALQIVQAAMACSTANDIGTLATTSELIAQLNRDYQGRYALWALAAGDDALGRTTLTWAGSPLSVTIPTDAVSLIRLEETDGTTVNLIPSTEKARGWHLAPACYRQGTVLVSRGETGDPIAGESLRLFYDSAPSALTTTTDTLDTRFPARFELLLIYGLALYVDAKDEGRDPKSHAALQAMYEHQDAIFQAVVGKADGAKQRSTNAKGTA